MRNYELVHVLKSFGEVICRPDSILVVDTQKGTGVKFSYLGRLLSVLSEDEVYQHVCELKREMDELDLDNLVLVLGNRYRDRND